MKPKELSRRRFLRDSIVGMTAAAALATTVADAEARGRMSKAAARYQDQPRGSQRCAGCRHFRGGTCARVEGSISPNGWCRLWSRAARGGGGGGARGGGGGGARGGGGGGGTGY